MYIAIGGFLAIRVGLVLPLGVVGAVESLFFGAVFPARFDACRFMRCEAFYRQLHGV